MAVGRFNKVATLTGFRIENVWSFCWEKNIGHNNEVAVLMRWP